MLASQTVNANMADIGAADSAKATEDLTLSSSETLAEIPVPATDTPETESAPVQTDETPSASTEGTPEHEEAASQNSETTAANAAASTLSAQLPASALAVTAEAVSADVSLLQGRAVTDQPASQDVLSSQEILLGAKGDFVVNTSDLVAGNTIVIADIIQTTTDPSGTLANLSLSNASMITLLDDAGKKVGTIQYDSALKALTLSVTDTVTSEADTQTYAFSGSYVFSFNSHMDGTAYSALPFSNTLSVTGNDYTFNLIKASSTDATTLRPDSISSLSNSLIASVYYYDYHSTIPDDTVLNQLQDSAGASGDISENDGYTKNIRVTFPSGSEVEGLTNAFLNLTTYYVSAAAGNKIQARVNETAALPTGNFVTYPNVNLGQNLTLSEIQSQASSTGIYYSRQSDGSYLLVEYVSPEDMILTDAQIVASVKQSEFYSQSSDPEADIQATLDYYHGVLDNKNTMISTAVQFTWADEYVANTLTAQQLDDSGNVTSTTTTTSTPNTIATSNTPVKIHYVDLSGQVLSSTQTKAGLPTGKEVAGLTGLSSGEAATAPAAVPGYTSVSSLDQLTDAQKAQLETTLTGLGMSSAKMDNTADKTVFATRPDSVPYPGYEDTYYDAAGNIVTDGTGTAGYGQTDVYYFYVGNPQKVVYNVIDDTDNTTLESNVKFDEGTSDANLTKTQEDFQKIADSYLAKGYDIAGQIDTVPGTFDADDAVDQVVNIHLKHTLQETRESREVNETIHYVYEDGTPAEEDAADKVTFTRTTTTDLVTKEVTSTDWTAENDDAAFDAVTSPEIENYTPDVSRIEAVTVTPDSGDVVKTVTYTANRETTTETKTVSEVIHYVYEDRTTAAPDKTDAVTFTRTATKNMATGDVTYGDWAAENNDTTFDAVTSPVFEGYTADMKTVDEIADLTADSEDAETTVTYKADPQKVVYNVIDDNTGESLEENVVFDEGSTDGTLTRTKDDLQAIADSYLDKGYEIGSVDDVPATFDNDDATDQIVNIHLSHATEDSRESKEVDETIHYVYEDGTEAAGDHMDKVTFTRTNTTDKVTGEVIASTDWIAENDDTTFDAVTSPEIDGYTADKSTVDAVTGLTADSEDTELTVTYKKDAEEPAPTPEPTDDTPTTPSSTPKASISVQPTSQTTKKSVLPSTGDEERSTVAAAGGLAVLGASLLGVFKHLRPKKR
ncbi:hypothetical protein OfM2_02980 [Lactovum odontotermitis]